MVDRNLGKGFFLLKVDKEETAKRLLLLTPYRSNDGLCVFQQWFADFDPTSNKTARIDKNGFTRSMKIPTWITLKQVPVEFMGVLHIAAGIGEVLGTDNSSNPEEPRFCLALDAHLGWEPSITVTNETTQIKPTILIDYNFLPIRCRLCLDTSHCVRDCPSRPSHRRPRQDRTVNGRSDSTRPNQVNAVEYPDRPSLQR